MIEDAESKSRPNIDELRLGILALSVPVTHLVAALRGIVNATLLDTLGLKFDLEKQTDKAADYTELVIIWPVSGSGVFALLRLTYRASGLLCMQVNGADVDCIACNSLCKYGSVQVQVTSDQSF